MLEQQHAPEKIWEYYERSQGVLVGYGRAFRRGVLTGGELEAFAGMTPSELYDELGRLRNELDRQVTMALTASFEAVIRIDFSDRVTRRLKDQVSQVFRQLQRQHGTNVRLDDILDTWKTSPNLNAQTIGRVKQLLGYRHWLAHGRYWTNKSGITPDPNEAWAIADAMFSRINSIGALPTTVV